MKTNYLYAVIFGMMFLTINSRSQNILFDGDFSQTTEIVLFELNPPPLNTWAYWRNFYGNGSDANPIVVDGECVFQIINPGDETWNVQLGQWGFPLILGHNYQLSFDVKADSERTFGVFLGEDGGNYTNLIPDHYEQYATTEWQTLTIEFEATSVFDLHKLSFELGADYTTTYFDNVILQDLNSVPAEKVVLAGTFQFRLGCNGNWLADCSNTQLNYNPESGLFEGDLNILPGCYDYKVVLDNNWQNNFGQEGVQNGENYKLYIPENPEVTHFNYDPFTHIVSSRPYGIPTEEITEVLLLGSLQDKLGCDNDYTPECENSELEFNSESGVWEGSFMLPAGCYSYVVGVTSPCKFFLYGENGGDEIELFVPTDSEVTFSFNPETHLITSTPYSGVPQDIQAVSLYGSLQNDLGCEYDSDYSCDKVALELDDQSGMWSGSFTLTAGCYFYKVKERHACQLSVYGENGIQEGDYISLYIPSDGEITFIYDPQTHLIISTPYSGIPQKTTSVSLVGNLQDEFGCSYDNDSECDKPALHLNPDTGRWEGNYILPGGCYTYKVKEKYACDAGVLYGEGGQVSGDEIQLYIPSEGEITFNYDPETHMISSTPYEDVPTDMTKVSLIGSLQDELGCAYDGEEECESAFLEFNAGSGTWEGTFDLPKGCYTYQIREASGCGTNYYGSNGGEIQLYVPSNGKITFIYDPQTHSIETNPYSGVPQKITNVLLLGSLQDELGCEYNGQYDCEYSSLVLNSELGVWERTSTLPAGCYNYRIQETYGCDGITYYGKDGVENGSEILLYVPTDGDVTFTYDPETHLINSTPFSSPEISKVSLTGTIQEILCGSDYDECSESALVLNRGVGRKLYSSERMLYVSGKGNICL